MSKGRRKINVDNINKEVKGKNSEEKDIGMRKCRRKVMFRL